MRISKLILTTILLAFQLYACAGSVYPRESPGVTDRVPERADLADPPTRRLRPGELILAATREDFPTVMLSEENFVDAQQAGNTWRDAEAVIGVLIGDDARAYPVRLLSLVEVVNDRVGEHEIAVTWCPLCFTAIVFDRQVGEQVLTFGVSGYLYMNNLVLFDHQSKTLWSQALGEGLKGAHRGERLELLPSHLTSWGQWKALHPESLILSAEGIVTDRGEIVDPYSGYYTSGAAGVAGRENEDERLPVKARVIGLVIGEESRAYPVPAIREVGLIEDTLAAEALLLVFVQSTETIAVYSRDTTAGVLDFELDDQAERMVDLQTGSEWEPGSGQAVAGALTGMRLARVEAPQIFWFAWADLFPQTGVYDRGSP